MPKLTTIIKGKFLTDGEALKRWAFVIYIGVLGLIMIRSSHSADSKVFRIAKLKNEIKSLKSHYVETTFELQRLKLKSVLTEELSEKGIDFPRTPPKKIIVQIDD